MQEIDFSINDPFVSATINTQRWYSERQPSDGFVRWLVMNWRHREPTHQHSWHNDDALMSALASQITSHTIVYSAVSSGTDQRKHESSSSLAFVQGIHRWSVNSPHKGPVTRKKLPWDDVIMVVSQFTRNIPGPAQHNSGDHKILLKVQSMPLTSVTSPVTEIRSLICYHSGQIRTIPHPHPLQIMIKLSSHRTILYH